MWSHHGFRRGGEFRQDAQWRVCRGYRRGRGWVEYDPGRTDCRGAADYCRGCCRDKLDCATDFGATDTVLAGKDLTDKIHTLTQGGADYVFVTTGAIAVFDTAPDLLARGGEMVMVGMPPVGAKANYEPINIVFSSQVLRGSRMGETVLKRDIPMLLSLYDQGRLKLDELITNRYGFAQINEAIADTRIGKCQRNVVIFD